MSASAGLRDLLPVLDPSAHDYLQFHIRRYQFLLNVIAGIFDKRESAEQAQIRILDVGMSFETALLQEAHPSAVVDTLGYFDHRFTSLVRGHHTNFDLNHADSPAAWPVLEPYDLVVMAEVIEHLHVAPLHVLRCASTWLRPGGTLLIQTPNPVSLGKRWSLLRGRNPFEMIREDPTNPGHFCEYTPDDLRTLGQRGGFEISGLWLRNYFGQGGAANWIYSSLCNILPGPMHDGITIVFRKPHV